MKTKRLPLGNRLLKLSKPNKTTGCIEWQHSKRRGYGRMIIGSRMDGTRKSVSAHRLAYELKYGPIPKGALICHKCDNPSCVNPDHLFLGDHRANAEDMDKKHRRGFHPLTGEDHPQAIMTWEEVKLMRAAKNVVEVKILAKIYGIAPRTVRDILNNKSWRIPEPPGKEGE